MTTETKRKGAAQAQVVTPEFRVSFPAVFAPKVAAEGQEPKYSIAMLFPKTTDILAIKQMVLGVLVAKLGPDKTKWPKGIRLPFRDGAEKDYDGYGKDVVFCSASSKQRPGLVDQKLQPIIDPSEFYGGCYARATIAAFYYDKAGNKGVSFGLRNVQKMRDGEPFSGRNKPENDFDAIEMPAGDGGIEAAGGAEDNDPLGGLGA